MNTQTQSVQASPSESLQVEEMHLVVRRSERRRVLQLTVDRDGELIISAPPSVGHAALASFVREKRFWIYTKLAEKEARERPAGTKEFVSGESFVYLGRSYRLLLVAHRDVPLKMTAGRFTLLRTEASAGREHFLRWYAERGAPWLQRRAAPWAATLGTLPKALSVRDLGYRWGSCSNSGAVNFHWATLLLPPSVIDYVIVHELAHLQHRNHTPEFWKLVARTLPQFAERKAWLAERGGTLVGL